MKKGTYAAQRGHDDRIMSSILTSEFLNTTDYADLIEEFADTIEDQEWLNKTDEILERTAPEGDGAMDYNIYDIV